LLLSQNSIQDALLLALGAIEGNFPEVPQTPDVASSVAVMLGRGNRDAGSALVKKCSEQLSARYYYKGNIYYSACIHLACNDTEGALSALYSGNELVLVLCIAQVLQSRSDVVVKCARTFARQCASKGDVKTGLTVLREFDPEVKNILEKSWSSAHALISVYVPVDKVEDKKLIHELIGLPEPFVALRDARIFADEGKPIDALQNFFIGTTPEEGLNICVDIITKQLSKLLKPNWTIDEFDTSIRVTLAIPTSVLLLPSSKIARCKILAAAAYVGAMKAVAWDYQTIVKPLLQVAASLVEMADDQNFPLKSLELNAEVRSVGEKDSYVKGMYKRRTPLSNDMEYMKQPVITIGSKLPSHSDIHTSTITGLKIAGAYVYMEDARTVMSLNEAIMWSRCNPFSPTCTGHRMHPY